MDTLTFVLNQSEVPRSFLITDNVPEQGRSGGGLFLESGELAGVCIGHTEMRDGRRMGVFASRESIQVLLEGHNLKAAVLRSESARAHRRASLPGSPQHEEEEADRQEPEDRQTAWSGIEEKDQRQEQAEHKAGQEHQPRAAGVRESAFGRAGAREFQRAPAVEPSLGWVPSSGVAAAALPRSSTGRSGGRNVRPQEGQRTWPSQLPAGASSSTRQYGHG